MWRLETGRKDLGEFSRMSLEAVHHRKQLPQAEKWVPTAGEDVAMGYISNMFSGTHLLVPGFSVHGVH